MSAILNHKKQLLLIFAFSCVCMLPSYIFGFGGHDAFIHGIWIKEFSGLLSQGVIFPKFAHTEMQGVGGYTFFFYPPLTFYIGSLFSFFASDERFYFDAVRLSSHSSIIISGLAFYFWIIKRAGRNGALVGAMLYMVNPALLLKSYYLTASIGMVWAYAWYPFILLGLDGINESNKKSILFTAVFTALLMLTNLPAALVFLPVAAIYFAINSTKKSNFIYAGLAAIIAVGLASYFIIPMLLMMKEVYVELHWDKQIAFYYDKLFIGLDYIRAVSKEPSKIIILLVQAVFMLVLAWLIITAKRDNKYSLRLLVLGAFGLFMTFGISNFVWKLFPPLQTIQFPDRFQIIPAVFLSAVLALNYPRSKDLSFVLIFTLLIITFMLKMTNQVDINNIERATVFRYKNNIVAFPVYQPKAPDILRYFYFSPIKEIAPLPHAEFAKGSGKIGAVVWNNRDLSVSYSASESSVLKVNRFYIHGWQAEINGTPAEIKFEDKMGIMLIDIPKCSDCTLKIWLPMLWCEKIGYIISAVSLFIFALLAYYFNRAKKPE